MTTKRKIKTTAWGNINGYEGGRKVVEFGNDEKDALLWLAHKCVVCKCDSDTYRCPKCEAESRNMPVTK